MMLVILWLAVLCAPAARADDGDPARETAAVAGTGAAQDAAMPVAGAEGVALPDGRFFATESDSLGYAIVDEPGGPPFWTSFQRLGGDTVLGSPVSRPFSLPDGRVYQATQYALLVWRPGAALAERADVLDMMAAAGLDGWLLARGIPRADRDAAPLARLGWLTDEAIRAAYFGEPGMPGESALPVPEALSRFGLPASPPQVFESHVTQRFQRGALRVVANPDGPNGPNGPDEGGSAPTVQAIAVGSLLRESGLLGAALAPDRIVGGLLVARAPRPQLAWRSDTGWGVLAAPPGRSVPPVATATTTSAPIAAAPAVGALSPAGTASPTSATGRPAAPPQPGASVVIQEIVNQGRAEHVVVANEGSAAQELTGWALHSAGGQTYAFPSGFVLAPGATVNVHSGAGDPAALNRPPADLFATRNNIWRNEGDVGQIVDPSGRIVNEKRYGGP